MVTMYLLACIFSLVANPFCSDPKTAKETNPTKPKKQPQSHNSQLLSYSKAQLTKSVCLGKRKSFQLGSLVLFHQDSNPVPQDTTESCYHWAEPQTLKLKYSYTCMHMWGVCIQKCVCLRVCGYELRLMFRFSLPHSPLCSWKQSQSLDRLCDLLVWLIQPAHWLVRMPRSPLSEHCKLKAITTATWHLHGFWGPMSP